MGYDYNIMKTFIVGAMEDSKVNKTQLETYYKSICLNRNDFNLV